MRNPAKTHWDYERKQSVWVVLIFLGLLVGETLFITLFSGAATKRANAERAVRSQYDNREITAQQYNTTLQAIEQDFQAQQAKSNQIVVIYFAVWLGVVGLAGLYMKIHQMEYENEQLRQDSIEATIELDAFDEAKYLIQSRSDSITEIKTTNEMLAVLENSEVHKSLMKAIESGIETFAFDQANFLKQKLEHDVKKLEAGKAKLAEEKTKRKLDDDQQLDENEKAEIKKADPEGAGLIEFTEKILENELPIDAVTRAEQQQYIDILAKFDLVMPLLAASKGLHLYYRPIEKIMRVDDSEIDPGETGEKDRLGECTGMIILLECEEKDRLKYRERKSPVEEIDLRKSYIEVRLINFVTGKTMFLIDQRLIAQLKVSDKSITDARVKALAFLTHLALERDQELRGEIEDLRVDIINLNRELDKKRDQELMKLLHSGALEETWRNRFQFEKVNLTTGIVAGLTMVIGVFLGMVFF